MIRFKDRNEAGLLADTAQIYGMEPFALDHLRVLEGDLSKLYEPGGNYVAAVYSDNDYGEAEMDSHWAKLGSTVTLRYVEEYEYYDPDTGEVKMLQPDAKVGDLRFIDTNGDGVINDNDRVLSRSYTPKQTYSFGGSLDWKGFDFSFMFQGVAGNYVYNGTKQLGMNGRQDLGNLTTDVYNTWDFKPMTSKYPRLGLSDDMNGNYLKVSDIFLEKGDYLRLKNITLGYTLPKHISRHIGMEKGSVRVYLSIDNVATITGYSGTDPEVGNYGLDSGIYPTSRFFNFGVNINF